MRKLALILGGVIFAHISFSQSVDLIKYDQLENIISSTKSKIIIVNFWATWCGPCIKELPYFESADLLKDVKVLLVSLDFPQEMEKVSKFVEKYQLISDLYLLDESDYDSYMGKIDQSWSGAIPATLIIKNGVRNFYEQSFTKEELFNEIDQYLK